VTTALAPALAPWTPFRVGGWPRPGCRLRVARTGSDLADLGHWLGERHDQLLGIDCETNALDPYQPGFRLRLVQLADLDDAWVVPVWSADGYYSCGQVLSRLIRDHPRWVAWFAENELRFLTRDPSMEDPIRLGEREPHIMDGQPLLALYDPRTVTTHSKKDRIDQRIPLPQGLKPTVTRLLTPALEAAEVSMFSRFHELAPVEHRTSRKMATWGFANIPLDDPAYLLYAALDPLCTTRLAHLLTGELTRRGQLGRARAAMTEQWVVDQATLAGMEVDAPYARWLDARLADRQAELGAVLTLDDVPPSGQGPRVAAAFRALGVSGRLTRESTESYDAARLTQIRDQAQAWLSAPEVAGPDWDDRRGYVERVYRLASNVTEARKTTKYRGTWVAPMLWTCDNADGAMHSSMRAIGTVTTRMTCRKTPTSGPMHSAPKRATTLLRAAVRARRGRVLVTADYRQAEPFVMAGLSGDEAYLADLRQGDINSVTAGLVYGDDYDPAQGKTADTPHYLMRQAAKFAILAAFYGAAPPKVATLLGRPEEEGARILSGWRGRWPRLWAYADEQNARQWVALDSGAVVPLWDRVWVDENGELRQRTWPDGNPRASRLGLNASTQGAQADLLKLSTHRLNHQGWAWALRFFMHDELVGEVPAPLAESFRQVLEAAMTVTYRGVVIHCDAEVVGRTWAAQPGEFNPAELPPADDEEE
jgi:DNA polymerase I